MFRGGGEQIKQQQEDNNPASFHWLGSTLVKGATITTKQPQFIVSFIVFNEISLVERQSCTLKTMTLLAL